MRIHRREIVLRVARDGRHIARYKTANRKWLQDTLGRILAEACGMTQQEVRSVRKDYEQLRVQDPKEKGRAWGESRGVNSDSLGSMRTRCVQGSARAGAGGLRTGDECREHCRRRPHPPAFSRGAERSVALNDRLGNSLGPCCGGRPVIAIVFGWIAFFWKNT